MLRLFLSTRVSIPSHPSFTPPNVSHGQFRRRSDISIRRHNISPSIWWRCTDRRIVWTDKDATDYFRGVVKSGEKSQRVLELTQVIIQMNPAHYSAW